MTATATKVSTLQMTVNVPVDIDLKYIDVWPNDLTKNNGKGYGASVAFKGAVDGEDVRVYPKGFANKTIEKLVNAGVIEDGHYEHDPAEKYSIPVKQGKLRIVNAQAAGEKFANFAIVSVNGKTPTTAAPTRSAAPKPSFASKPEAELPEFLRDAEKQDAAALKTKLGVIAEKIQVDLALYQAITEWVIENISPLYANGIGWTPESATAAVATIFIQAKRNQ